MRQARQSCGASPAGRADVQKGAKEAISAEGAWPGSGCRPKEPATARKPAIIKADRPNRALLIE